MSEENEEISENETDETWTEVEGGPPQQQKTDEARVDGPEDEHDEERVYEGKKALPPWKLSLYTGIAGLVLMSAIFFLPEFRRVATPWNPSYPAAHLLFIFPIFGLIWAMVGLLGAQFREERGRAWRGIIVAVLTVILGYTVIVTDPMRDAENSLSDADDRLEMTEEELRAWRVKRLDR